MGGLTLSVIVPVYNGEKFLAEAIASIRRSSQPSEIIVVDDGSVDQTATVAKNYGDVIYSRQENAGPAAARNHGLQIARGNVIAFLDADDVWAAGHPEKGIDYLQRHPEADAVLGQVQYFLSSNSGFEPSGKPFHSYQVGAALVRRELIDQIGQFSPTMRYGEDVDWFLRIRESGAAISALPELALYYRLHPGNQPGIYANSRAGLLNAFRHSLQRRRSSVTAPVPAQVGRPLISVVVPVFNGERFVAKAIQSVLAQDYRPIELIVVDDASTDQTRAIVSRLSEVILLQQPHRGAGAARNAGVRASKGEFIAFLDADDVWENEKLSRQMRAFDEDASLEAVFGHAIQFQEPLAGGSSKSFPSPIPGTLLIRRTSFERIGWFSEEPNELEGVEWLLRANEQFLCAKMLPDVVYRRRIHDENRSIVNRNLNGYVRALKKSLDRRRATMGKLSKNRE